MSQFYKIKVDGKVYEVEVEETGSLMNTAPVAVAPVSEVSESPKVSAPVAPSVEPAPVKSEPASANAIKGRVLPAPMPGTILSVSVSAGQTVQHGQVLMVLEAMKMENEIVADADGVIEGVYVSSGASVNAGTPLVSFA
ncbi:MAG: biotin/lipoyl-binding protein [Clostridiaceae bacterium]|nr:biotin/lipoyl-binding protein [Clostridiaceae bacterium]